MESFEEIEAAYTPSDWRDELTLTARPKTYEERMLERELRDSRCEEE